MRMSEFLFKSKQSLYHGPRIVREIIAATVSLRMLTRIVHEACHGTPPVYTNFSLKIFVIWALFSFEQKLASGCCVTFDAFYKSY